MGSQGVRKMGDLEGESGGFHEGKSSKLNEE